MDVAMAHYEGQGWHVTDGAAIQSYDLYCRRGEDEALRVEVKGTTTAGAQVLLTRGEVEHARAQYPQVALFIVAHITVSGTDETEYAASGGESIIYAPWRIEDGELAPLAFAYVPSSR
jgi:Domain of unknown function (DUF3883)